MSRACVVRLVNPGGGVLKAVVTATVSDQNEIDGLRSCLQRLCLSRQYGCTTEGPTVSVTCPPPEAVHIRDLMVVTAEGEGFEVQIN